MNGLGNVCCGLQGYAPQRFISITIMSLSHIGLPESFHVKNGWRLASWYLHIGIYIIPKCLQAPRSWSKQTDAALEVAQAGSTEQHKRSSRE